MKHRGLLRNIICQISEVNVAVSNEACLAPVSATNLKVTREKLNMSDKALKIALFNDM